MGWVTASEGNIISIIESTNRAHVQSAQKSISREKEPWKTKIGNGNFCLHRTPRKYSCSLLKKACDDSLYPSQCRSSLYPHACVAKMNLRKLTIAATSIALAATKNATGSLTDLHETTSGREQALVSDCLKLLRGSTDSLKNSIVELQHLKKQTRESQLDDVNIKISHALTSQGTCTDGLEDLAAEGKVKKAISQAISEIKKHTSIALAVEKRLAGSFP